MSFVWYNDVELLPLYPILIAGYFLILFGAIIFHEFGHWLYFKRIGKSMKIKFVYENIFSMRLETGILEDYKNMSDEDYMYSLWCGVLAGLVPIIMGSLVFYPMSLLVIPYGVGCISDLKEINKVYVSQGRNFLDLEDEDDVE